MWAKESIKVEKRKQKEIIPRLSRISRKEISKESNETNPTSASISSTITPIRKLLHLGTEKVTIESRFELNPCTGTLRSHHTQ